MSQPIEADDQVITNGRWVVFMRKIARTIPGDTIFHERVRQAEAGVLAGMTAKVLHVESEEYLLLKIELDPFGLYCVGEEGNFLTADFDRYMP